MCLAILLPATVLVGSIRPYQTPSLCPMGKTLQELSRCCLLPRRRKPRPNEPRAQRHLRLPCAHLIGSRANARRHLKKYASKSYWHWARRPCVGSTIRTGGTPVSL